MGNQPYSGTAGAPPGTILGGPIRMTREMGEAATSSHPTALICVGPFSWNTVLAASTSAVMYIGSTVRLAAQKISRFALPKDGSIVGVSGALTTGSTTGTWQLRVVKNSAGLGLTVASTTNGATMLEYMTTNLTSYKYSDGDNIQLKLITSAGFAPTTIRATGYVWLT